MKRVMLVDDSLVQLTAVNAHLDGSKFSVVARARTGAEAVAKYGEVKPDLVLLDVVMPDQPGTATLRQILDLDPMAFVIMLSSLGSEAMIEECLNIGARSFLQKPVTKSDLLEFLDRTVPATGARP